MKRPQQERVSKKMLHVSPVSRETIDGWLVQNSGLPIRVVNAVTKANVCTIGELRTWNEDRLLELKSLGKISLNHIRNFFTLCNQIESNQKYFRSLQEVFDLFLDTDESRVISLRYGFNRPDLQASRNYYTLQKIGNLYEKTRERVRQIEDNAKTNLNSKLSKVCLQPFYSFFIQAIEQTGGVVGTNELKRFLHQPLLEGHNPCSLLLLFRDLQPERIRHISGFFTTLDEPTLEAIESGAVEHLKQAARPLTLQALSEAPALKDLSEKVDDFARVLLVVMDHCRSVFSTQDMLFMHVETGVGSYLVNMVNQMNRPAHYRTITNTFNDRVKPQSQKGAGFILEQLNKTSDFVRIDRGIYSLNPSSPTPG